MPFCFFCTSAHLGCGDSLRWSGHSLVFGGIPASTLGTAVSTTWPCESCWVQTRCWEPPGWGRSPAWSALLHLYLGSEAPASSLWGPASPDSSHPGQDEQIQLCFSAEKIKTRHIFKKVRSQQKCSHRQWRDTTHTFLFLWHTLTRSTSRDTEFCSFSLSWDGFPENTTTQTRLPESPEALKYWSTAAERLQTYQLYERSR